MNLEQQIAHAQALLANGKRLEELTAKRSQLVTDLAAVDSELAELLGPATPAANGRAPQKCSLCNQEGHSKRTCPTKGSS